MGPLVALGIGLIPTLIGGLLAQKPEPKPAPPPPDHTPDLLKAMQDQHKEDMATINRLIDKLDARERGNTTNLALGDPPGQTGARPTTGQDVPAGGGPASPANAAASATAATTGDKPGAADPRPPVAGGTGDITQGLVGIMQELVKLMTTLTGLLARLLPAGPASLPPVAPVPLTADQARAAVTAN